MMSAEISTDLAGGTATRDGVVAELGRLRACASLRGMDRLRDLLDAIVDEMVLPTKA
jgi:hypothetical protein